MRTKIKKGILLLLGAVLCLDGCTPASRDPEEPQLKEPLLQEIDRLAAGEVSVLRTNIYDMRALWGSILSYYEPAAFQTSGTIKSLAVKRGDRVKKGQVLARLDDSFLQEQKAELVGKLDAAKALAKEKNRILEIEIEILQLETEALGEETEAYEKDLMEMDIREIKYRLEKQKKKQQEEQTELQNRIREINAQIENTILRAPADGVIGWIAEHEAIGDKVKKEQVFVHIHHMDKLYIRSAKIPNGQMAQCDQLYARVGDQQYELTEIDPEQIEEAYRPMFENRDYSYFSADLPKDHSIVAEWGNVMVCCRYNYQENVLAVSVDAILYEDGKPYVYRIEDGNNVRVDVELGVRTTLYQEIVSGLQEGDMIYVPN